MDVRSAVICVAPDEHVRDERLTKQTVPTAADPRSPARHDRDRVYYSHSFRRLAGVTQVTTPDAEGFLTHNRLTHSLKVAQVGRSIAELLLSRSECHETLAQLGGLDAEAVEAAALAHDLGHPPFGHIGEGVLDRFGREDLGLPEGYEGNAQAFRIVARLEPRSRHENGLDLTAAVRAAILKYPWSRGSEPEDGDDDPIANLRWEKFGVYEADRPAFDTARASVPVPEFTQSVEAAAMDIADDITYALHDLEDFHGSGILDTARAEQGLEQWKKIYAGKEIQEAGPLVENAFELLRGKLSRTYPDRFDEDVYEGAADAVRNHISNLQTENVGSRRATAGTRRFVSQLISDFVSAVQLIESPSPVSPPLQFEVRHWHQVQILKELTRQFVIKRTDFAVIQRGQQALLRSLLHEIKEWCADKKDRSRLPRALSEAFDAYGERAILDYVAGLSDHQASALNRALCGDGRHSLATTFM